MNELIDTISDAAFLGVVPLGFVVIWELIKIRRLLTRIESDVSDLEFRDNWRFGEEKD